MEQHGDDLVSIMPVSISYRQFEAIAGGTLMWRVTGVVDERLGVSGLVDLAPEGSYCSACGVLRWLCRRDRSRTKGRMVRRGILSSLDVFNRG